MSRRKLIIFDLDGTLYELRGGSFLNSKLNRKIIENAGEYIQIKLNKNKVEATEILKEIKGKYGENISIALEKEYNLNRYDYFNYVWNIKPSRYIKKYNNLKNILTRLSRKYNFLLVSDAPIVWIKNVLEELEVEYFFRDNILSGEGDKRKNFGNRFTGIAEEYNLNPEQIIVIGDQEDSDIIPARELGFKTIYVNKNKSKYADINIKNIKNIKGIFYFA